MKFAVHRHSWGLPVAFRYDFPCDWWVVSVFCFHWGFSVEGVEWGFWRSIHSGIVDGLHRLWIF